MFSNPIMPLQILAQFLIPMVFMGIPPLHTSILESCPLQYDFKSKNIPGLQIKQILVPINLLETYPPLPNGLNHGTILYIKDH